MRFALVVCAAAFGLASMVAAGPAGAEPPVADSAAPDLSGYTATPVDPYVTGPEVYFQTPDGLLCAIRPGQGRAGCDGPLPGAPAGANEVVLAIDQQSRGLRATTNPQFVKPTGAAAPILSVGHKIAFADFECAVGQGPITVCVKGTPPSQWMTIGPTQTGIGPPTAGLPEGFPDPNAFVAGDDTFVVGVGAKNMFPVFTVPRGLTCKMSMFSGGEIGCDGTLPGAREGDNEVFAQLPGPVGTRKAGTPPFSTPNYPGVIRELPVGRRIDSYGATCMATADGGVACFGAVGSPPQGFAVTADATTTFGGS